MHALLLSAKRRLPWSRWLVLALMALCLPLQGALAVTMQMGMALQPSFGMASSQAVQTSLHLAHAVQAEQAASPDPQGVPPATHAHHAAVTASNVPDQHRAGIHAGHPAGPLTHGPATEPITDAGPCDASGSSHGCSSDAHHGCSFCAQCCIGVALLATPLTVTASGVAAAPPAPAPAAVLERQPQTPDRPPKHRLA